MVSTIAIIVFFKNRPEKPPSSTAFIIVDYSGKGAFTN